MFPVKYFILLFYNSICVFCLCIAVLQPSMIAFILFQIIYLLLILFSNSSIRHNFVNIEATIGKKEFIKVGGARKLLNSFKQ